MRKSVKTYLSSVLSMRKSFMALLKYIAEMRVKTYLSTFPHMLKNFMAWLFTAITQLLKDA